MQILEKTLSIGLLSTQTNCKIETIRYYEKIGIFPKPPRTEGGHRIYSENHLKRLVFIRRGRELGFSLEDIRALLKLIDGGGTYLSAGGSYHSSSPRKYSSKDFGFKKAGKNSC